MMFMENFDKNIVCRINFEDLMSNKNFSET